MASKTTSNIISLDRKTADDNERKNSSCRTELLTFQSGELTAREDLLAAEEALQIRVAGASPVITMRTPGNDLELAAGLLLSEGVIRQSDDIKLLEPKAGSADTVNVVLKYFTENKEDLLSRSSLSNSACGVCGKDKLNLEPMQKLPELPDGPNVEPDLLLQLPQKLRSAQGIFEHTGGLHAAALFDASGELEAVREDVGRHNAMDKLNGWALLDDHLPLHEHIVLLSGRASFELLQKCIMARVSIVCAISAPSSYAVRLAQEFGVTLVGFLRGDRFNVYAGAGRIHLAVQE
jgi:FdhD protein